MTPGAGAPTTSFDGSVCSGSYTDPFLGGTDVYVIGAVSSGPALPLNDSGPYYAYVVYEGGPLGADYSQIEPVQLTTLAAAQAYCTTITTATPAFGIVAASELLFKV